MKKIINLLKQQDGIIALSVAILAPIIIGLLVIGFDTSNLLNHQARLSDALREASLGASTLKNDAEKRQYIQSYLKAYFHDKNLKFSNIKNTAQTLKKIKDQKTQEEENAEIINSYADLSIPGWFRKFIDKQNQNFAQAKISVKSPNAHIDTDYLFVLDFSESMSRDFVTKISHIGFCTPNDPEYDEIVCTRLKNSSNRAEVMQAVIYKIIKTINSNPNSQSQLGFLPFYAGTQIQKNTHYDINLGDKPISRDTTSSYYVLQVTFKPQYRLSDYDFWSGIMTSVWAQNDTNLTFEKLPYSINPEKQKALNFFHAFSNPQSNLISNIETNLPQMIDYEATLENMFDPLKIFSFRFYNFTDTNPLIPNSRRNGVAYDFYGKKDQISHKSMRSLDMKFYEEDFQPISDPKNFKILNEKPFDASIKGGKLTLVTTAILRGSAMLTKGKNKKRIMIIVTDGIDGEALGKGTYEERLAHMEDRLFSMGMCKRIKDNFKAKGVETDIFFINIAKKIQSQNTLQTWQKCAGQDNAQSVENIDEFLHVLKSFIFGNKLGKFVENY
ncbi:TadE/TadG family type IV pilus assembly protein [Helicobacter sp. 11S03491-1]|uniref:TadE/TadG family type IV pilus assembly protein n=1 Tax=Helicobacter sp. 11S03491-1 TaxID=1476196 RepID=UPI000BA66C85|nr:TadE/TadG family type IV pilus assembly protein [Helicobacter sp. 11S03491-1]PAF43364.1 hypothetical protein BKH45_01615 [Helicobacter sp. 11S03491-1]